MEFLISSNLAILNRGNGPNFCNIARQEVIDITLGALGLLDHTHILSTLWGCVPVALIRKPRGTNWDSFREDLRRGLERGPELSMKEAVLGVAVHWLQQVVISPSEDKWHFHPSRICKKSLK